MTIYTVFSQDNALISAHQNAAAAIKAALIYQHYNGRPAYVEQVSDAAYQAADDLAEWQNSEREQ